MARRADQNVHGGALTRYRIVFPDGTTDRRRTEFAGARTAKAVCFQSGGFWLCLGVFNEVPERLARDVRPDWVREGSALSDHLPYTIVNAARIG